MAKELPYFKFDVSEWISGSITLEDFYVQGVFINICAHYWFKSGCLRLTEIKRRVKCKESAINSLIENNLIKIDPDDKDTIVISFLDEQLDERDAKRLVNKINGSKGGAPKGNNNAKKAENNNPETTQKQPETTNIEERRIREEEKREEESGAGEPATQEQRAFIFFQKLEPFLKTYTKEMLRAFYDYWTEKNEGGRKMRFEMQKVFDIQKRLITWHNNETKSHGINGTRKSGITAQGTLDRLNSYT